MCYPKYSTEAAKKLPHTRYRSDITISHLQIKGFVLKSGHDPIVHLTVVMVTMAHQYASKIVLKLVLGSSFSKTNAREANMIAPMKSRRKRRPSSFTFADIVFPRAFSPTECLANLNTLITLKAFTILAIFNSLKVCTVLARSPDRKT